MLSKLLFCFVSDTMKLIRFNVALKFPICFFFINSENHSTLIVCLFHMNFYRNLLFVGAQNFKQLQSISVNHIPHPTQQNCYSSL